MKGRLPTDKTHAKAPAVLYISTNDGSDTRINKEVGTLTKEFKVYFLGIGRGTECFFCKKGSGVDDRVDSVFISGSRRDPIVLLRLVIAAIRLIPRVGSVHIVNEVLVPILFPVLLFKKTIIDLFDSIFLKYNAAGNKMWLPKRIIYGVADRILVTDSNRYRLLPTFAKRKSTVLPNYPIKRSGTTVPRRRSLTVGKLTLLYYGWLANGRGTEVVEAFVTDAFPVRVIAAGWFGDSYTETMFEKYATMIDYRGVVDQSTALRWAENEADYILCVYAPTNQNQINASPNKVYDAIQVKTPLIVNQEILISEFVHKHRLGYVLPSYRGWNVAQILSELQRSHDSFTFPKALRNAYSWEAYESELLRAHRSPQR